MCVCVTLAREIQRTKRASGEVGENKQAVHPKRLALARPRTQAVQSEWLTLNRSEHSFIADRKMVMAQAACETESLY